MGCTEAARKSLQMSEVPKRAAAAAGKKGHRMKTVIPHPHCLCLSQSGVSIGGGPTNQEQEEER